MNTDSIPYLRHKARIQNSDSTVSTLFSAPRIIRLWCVIALLLVGGCANNPNKPIQINGSISATTVLNPDISGKYRPVNIKVYYLKSEGAFNQAGFNDLYNFTDKVLADSVLHISNHQLLPGQSLELKEQAPQGVKYLGVVAAFRNIEDAQWKDIQAVPSKCFFCWGPGLWEPVKIEAERLSIRLDLGKKPATTKNTTARAPATLPSNLSPTRAINKNTPL